MHPELGRLGGGGEGVEGGDRHQPGGAAVQHCDEKPEPGHAGNARGKAGADFVRHVCSDVTVDRVALGQRRPPLGGGDVGAGVGEVRRRHRPQPVRPQPQPGDQGPVHQKVGVAPDRAGEVRVLAERQPEMPEVVGAVFGLRLRPQHHLVDLLRPLGAGDLGQHAVQVGRADLAGRFQRDVQRRQEVPQRVQPLGRRRRVHPVHAGLAQPLQLLRRGDVGQHHELLDQPVAVPPRPRRDRRHPSLRGQRHAPLGQVEVERAAPGARRQQGRVGAVEAAEQPRRQAERAVVVAGVGGVLHLVVGEPGSAAHQPAAEAVRALGAAGVDPHLDEQAAARLAGLQRAPAVRQRLRAASAPRGRGSRPSCRASAPRGPAPSRRGRSAPRRRSPPAAASRPPDRARRTPRRRSRAHPRRRSSPAAGGGGRCGRTARPRRRPRPRPARHRGRPAGCRARPGRAGSPTGPRPCRPAAPAPAPASAHGPHAAAARPAPARPGGRRRSRPSARSTRPSRAGRWAPPARPRPAGRAGRAPRTAPTVGTRRAPGRAAPRSAAACGPRSDRRRSAAAGPARAAPGPAPAGLSVQDA